MQGEYHAATSSDLDSEAGTEQQSVSELLEEESRQTAQQRNGNWLLELDWLRRRQRKA